MSHDLSGVSVCKGLSTYDYIVIQRERAEEAARDKDVENHYSPKRSLGSVRTLVFRLFPTSWSLFDFSSFSFFSQKS